MGALTALCYAGSSHAYQDLLQTVPLSDQSIYNRLGVFVSILIARHCFQVQAFVSHVAIPSLLKAWDEVKEGHSSREAEVGARLSCHLLLMLFQSIEGSSAKPSFGSGIKHSCDRQLLANAVRNITVGLLIAVLKVILVLGDAEDPSKGPGVKIFNVDDDDDDDDGFSLMYKSSSKNSMHKAKLSDFAKHTLKQICNQEWVHNRCLQVIYWPNIQKANMPALNIGALTSLFHDTIFYVKTQIIYPFILWIFYNISGPIHSL